MTARRDDPVRPRENHKKRPLCTTMPGFVHPGIFHAMKKRTLLSTAAAAALSALLAACGKTEPPAANTAASAPQAEPQAAQPAPPPARLVIGLDDNFPPMGFRDENNEIVGFDIDMAREAAQRMALQVEFKAIDWSAKEAELLGKRVDALWNGLTITEERRQNIAFTAPYMENHQIIVVRADSDIADKAALAGKVIGAQEGSSAVDAIKKEETVAASLADLKTFGDNITALMDLSAGRLDAVVLDEVVGRYQVAKKPDDYKVLEDNFGTEEYGVGLRKDDGETLAQLDAALAAMKQDGTAARLATKWFGKDVTK